MLVGLSPGAADERGDGPAGAALLDDLAEFIPRLNERRDELYVTTLVKCRAGTNDDSVPTAAEFEHCYPYLSQEFTITTPHYVLTIGATATTALLARLYKDPPPLEKDPLAPQVFDNPAFKVVALATPDELRAKDAKTRKQYVERLRTLARTMLP